MERDIIFKASGRIYRFLGFLDWVVRCTAIAIVPIGALALSRMMNVADFIAPTWLHTLLILTPAMSAIATLFAWRRSRMSYHEEVPHQLVRGHVRPIAALLGMRRLGVMLTSRHLPSEINGLFVQRGSKALRRNWVDVRAVVGLLQGVAIAVSLAYTAFLDRMLWLPHFDISPLFQFIWLILSIIVLLLPASRFVLLALFLFLILNLFLPATVLGEFGPQLSGAIFVSIFLLFPHPIFVFLGSLSCGA